MTQYIVVFGSQSSRPNEVNDPRIFSDFDRAVAARKWAATTGFPFRALIEAESGIVLDIEALDRSGLQGLRRFGAKLFNFSVMEKVLSA